MSTGRRTLTDRLSRKSEEASILLIPTAKQQDGNNEIPQIDEILATGMRIVASRWCVAVILFGLLAVTLAYQFNPTTHIKIGGGYDAPFLNTYDLAYIDNWAGGFGDIVRFDENATQDAKGYGPEPVHENYRWTREHPAIFLPGAGSAAELDLRAAASPVYPAGQMIRVVSNGRTLTSFVMHPGVPAHYQIDLGESDRGNYTVELYVAPNGSADAKVEAPADGFKLYDIWVTPRSNGLVPPLGIAISLALTALGLYWVLAFLRLQKPYAFFVSILFLSLAGFMLAVQRLDLTIYVWRLLLLFGVAVVSLIALDWIVPRIFRWAGIPLPRWAGRILLALFAVGLLLRGAGVLYPQMLVIDARAHLVEIWKVTQGQLVDEYTNHVLSQVPGQWQLHMVIPYSTVSYFLFAPFALLPIDIHVSINMVNILLDALRVFIVAALAIALGAQLRAALIAAGLYLIVPSTWLLNSWGNWPTTLSFWLASLFLTLILLQYRRMNDRKVWFGLTALLTLTMLVYTVTAVFMVVLLSIWAIGLFFFIGRKEPLARRNALLVTASTVTAAVAAFALYFWQFVPDVLNSLTVANSTLSGGKGLGVDETSFSSYLEGYLDRILTNYGVGWLLLATLLIMGWVGYRRYLKHRESRVADNLSSSQSGGHIKWLVGAWFTVFVLFSFVGWKVDMVDKQVWFIVPLVCALAGIALFMAWQYASQHFVQRRIIQYGVYLATLALTSWLVYMSADLWIYRIFIKDH